MPNQQKIGKTSLYKAVYWYKQSRKWKVSLVKGGKPKFGGTFHDEVNAAKKVNQLCEELGIPPYNPTISGIPNQQGQAKGKTSQYKGVYWNGERRKWCVQLRLKGGISKCGGRFTG